MHLWIEGSSRSGKTQEAIAHLSKSEGQTLVITVDAQRRRQLAEQWQGNAVLQPWQGFVQEQVLLFFPLLIKLAGLANQLPIVLRVETEQALARNLWGEELRQMTGNRERLVRRLLDLYLLAGNSGKQIEAVGDILERGSLVPLPIAPMMTALQRWRVFCWQYNLLTYGIVAHLFAQYLLPHRQFQQHCQKFSQLWMDCADELPAIAQQFCQTMLSAGMPITITYNPDGEARSGLGADAPVWLRLKHTCTVIDLPVPPDSLTAKHGEIIQETVFDPTFAYTGEPLPIYLLETVTRGKLLRNTAEFIAEAIAKQHIQPEEIGIIAPGVEAIARYAFTEIFSARGIPVVALDNQRPLNQSPQVRALLSLLTLCYPHLGQMVDLSDISEMLTVLDPRIDPVRAGILAEYCFLADLAKPRLEPAQTYAHWERLGYCASTAYTELCAWIATHSRPLPAPILLIDRAIQHFYQPQTLSHSQVLELRELMETAQHHWEIAYRLGTQLGQDPNTALERFITEIRNGTPTANPYPTRPQAGITISNIFQYRMARGCHRWQFWLDVSSDYWLIGGAAVLDFAPLFRSDWNGSGWTPTAESGFNYSRLRRILKDLLCRCTERVYLCHSDLSTAGQEQTGILQSLLELANSRLDLS